VLATISKAPYIAGSLLRKNSKKRDLASIGLLWGKKDIAFQQDYELPRYLTSPRASLYEIL